MKEIKENRLNAIIQVLTFGHGFLMAKCQVNLLGIGNNFDILFCKEKVRSLSIIKPSPST